MNGSAIFSSWILPVALAPVVGSFLSALVARADNPHSVLWGRSRCVVCGHHLGPRDLVPVASWLALRGRCRYCTQRISWFYPAMELAALAVAIWAAVAATDRSIWVTSVLGWALLSLAAADFKHYLLPVFLTGPLIAAGVIVNWQLDRPNISSYLLGAAVGYLFVIILRVGYRLWRDQEGIGLGDAKLLAAAGAWLSWQSLPAVVLLAALLGLLSVLPQCFSGKHTPSLTDRVPFGAFLCVAIWLVWLYGPFPFVR